MGTLFAAVIVPDDVEPNRAFIIPALVLAVGLALGPAVAAVRAPRSVFHPLHILLLAPVYWLLLDPIQGAYELDGVTPQSARFAVISIGVFCSAAWLASFQRPWPIPTPVRAAMAFNPNVNTLFIMALLAFSFAFARFAIPARFDLAAMLQALYGGRWSVPWGRGALGGWDAFLDHLVYFGYLLPGLTALLARRKGWTDIRTIACGSMTAIIVVLSMTEGGRRIVGVMAGIAMLLWFLSARNVHTRHLIQAGVAAALILFVLQLVIDYRNVGIGGMLSANQDIVDRQYIQGVTSQPADDRRPIIRVDDNFYRLCQIIQIIPDEHPYVTWRWVLWVAVRPIPRALWSGKPVDPGFDLPSHNGMKGVSLSMSLIGEAYMAFGIFGVILGGWLMGRLAMGLAAVMEGSQHIGSLMLFGCGTMALFAGMRSGIDLVLMSYISLAWIALTWMLSQTLRTSTTPGITADGD